jgi:hypothetical protein
MRGTVTLLATIALGLFSATAHAGQWYFQRNVQDFAVSARWLCSVYPSALAGARTVLCQGTEVPFQRTYDMHEVTQCAGGPCSSSCKCGATQIGADLAGRYYTVTTSNAIFKQSDDKTTWLFETALPATVAFQNVQDFAVSNEPFATRRDFWIRTSDGATWLFEGNRRLWFNLGSRKYVSIDYNSTMYSAAAATPTLVDYYWEPGAWVRSKPVSMNDLWIRNGNFAIGYAGYMRTDGPAIEFKAWAGSNNIWYRVYDPLTGVQILPNGGRVTKLVSGGGLWGRPIVEPYANAFVLTTDWRLYSYESSCSSTPC